MPRDSWFSVFVIWDGATWGTPNGSWLLWKKVAHSRGGRRNGKGSRRPLGQVQALNRLLHRNGRVESSYIRDFTAHHRR